VPDRTTPVRSSIDAGTASAGGQSWKPALAAITINIAESDFRHTHLVGAGATPARSIGPYLSILRGLSAASFSRLMTVPSAVPITAFEISH
jgi:hypothetical protein